MQSDKTIFSRILLVIVITSSFWGPLLSQNSSNSTNYQKLGLVLSGGGAKGMAHVGLLKTLDSLHLKVSYIGGTSMGSIVSALYACGYSGREIEWRLKRMNWQELFNDEISLDRVSIEEKADHLRFLLDVPFRKGKVKLPSGIIRGPNLYSEFVKLTFPYIDRKSFDSLPVVLRVNAVDLEKGENVVFDKGYLPAVMRASMSIPSVFYPVEMDSGYYVDGGVVRNTLIPEIKAMNPDLLMVSFTGNKLATKDELNSITSILSHVFFITGSRDLSEHEQEADLFVQPELNSKDAGSFKRADDIINAGDVAVMRRYEEIKNLGQKYRFEKLEQPKPFHNDEAILAEKFIVEDIKYSKLNAEDQRFFEAVSGLKPHSELNLAAFFDAIKLAYSSLRYDYIYYEMEFKGYTPEGKKRIVLKFHVTESADVNVRLSPHFDTDLGSGILVNIIARDLAVKRSRLVIEADIAQSPRGKLNYLFFINRNYSFQIGTNNQGEQNLLEAYNNRISTESYKMRIFKNYNFLQWKVKRNMCLHAGYETEFLFFSPRISSDTLFSIVKSINSVNSSIVAGLQVNTLNRQVLPTKGIRLQASYKYLLNSNLTLRLQPETRKLNGNKDITETYSNYGKINVSFELFQPLSKQLVFFIGADGNIFTNNVFNPFDVYFLGSVERNNSRSLSMVGYRNAEIQAANYLMSNTGLQWNVFSAFYLKATVSALVKGTDDYQDLYRKFDAENNGQVRHYGGGALTFSYLIPKLGPLSFTVHKSFNRQQVVLYASLGYKFQSF